jgi:hypothetical protein
MWRGCALPLAVVASVAHVESAWVPVRNQR